MADKPKQNPFASRDEALSWLAEHRPELYAEHIASRANRPPVSRGFSADFSDDFAKLAAPVAALQDISKGTEK